MIQTTFLDTEITYNESTNKWECDVRGRSRAFDSLATAKDAISKVPPEKKKEFPRQKAISFGYGGLKEVEVTSFAGFGGYDRKKKEFWTVDSDGKRNKIDGLYAHSPENLAIVDKSKALNEQARELDKEARELINTLAPFEIPEGVDAQP